MNAIYLTLTDREIFEFYNSLADNVQKAVFMRDLAHKANLTFEDMSNCFTQQYLPNSIKEIAKDLVKETKLKLANSFHLQLIEQ